MCGIMLGMKGPKHSMMNKASQHLEHPHCFHNDCDDSTGSKVDIGDWNNCARIVVC